MALATTADFVNLPIREPPLSRQPT